MIRFILSAHYNPANQTVNGKGMCSSDWSNGTDYSAGFHIFTTIYSRTEIKWYVDGTLIRTLTRWYTTLTQPIPCQNLIVPQTYLMSKAFPKGTPSNIIINSKVEYTNATVPNMFEIDYVKYWVNEVTATPCNNDVIELNPFTGTHIGDNALLIANAVAVGNTEVIARNQIRIYPNFRTYLGSTFHAKIDPFACGNSARIGDTTNNVHSKGFVQNDYKEKEIAESIIPEISSSQFKVYPNPSQGEFTLELRYGTRENIVEIYDIMGKKVWSKTVSKAKTQIDISTQPKGIYLVKVISGNAIFTKKIIYQ